jgi:DNA repair protein RadA/Sms
MMRCNQCNTELQVGKSKCHFCGHTNIAEEFGDNEVLTLDKIEPSDVQRIDSGICNEVWGGGIVPDSVTLLGGSPGAGKSTLCLQLGSNLGDVLYIASEENPGQIKARANRIGITNQEYIRIMPVKEDGAIRAAIERYQPDAVIVDSLSGLYGDKFEPAREFIKLLKEYAEKARSPIILIDHVTKDLEFAGRMALQHLVDATITIFPSRVGELSSSLFGPQVKAEEEDRTIMAMKNRHGPAFCKMILCMTPTGLTVKLPGERKE